MSFEYKYQNVLSEALFRGTREENRTGVATYGTWGKHIEHDLSEGFPILTSRKISFRIAAEELLFFLSGNPDTSVLEDKGIYIWHDNTTREFLDSRGLDYLPERHLGRAYGIQWRDFRTWDIENHQFPDETDQIEVIKDQLINNPQSRRILLSAWHPGELHKMALEPCHVLYQFRVREGKYLDSHMYQRSADLYHGVPYNIQETALLTHLFALWAGLQPGKMVISFGDAHVYERHVDHVKELLGRQPKALPQLKIARETGCDPLSVTFDDLTLEGYDPHPALEKVDMVQ